MKPLIKEDSWTERSQEILFLKWFLGISDLNSELQDSQSLQTPGSNMGFESMSKQKPFFQEQI